MQRADHEESAHEKVARMTHRIDRVLRRMGLMRMSQQSIERMDYDFQSGEIHIEFKGAGWQNRIHGFVCPTPDGPLKGIVNPSNPVFDIMSGRQ